MKNYDEQDFLFEKESEVVFVENYPQSSAVVDGAMVSVYARRNGRHSYTNTQGARNTVSSYDHGTIPSESEIENIKQDFDKKVSELQRRNAELAERSKEAADLEKKKKKEQAQLSTFLFYQKKALDGDGLYQFRLGELYLNGIGTATNIDLARHWFLQAATNEHPGALEQFNAIRLQR